MPPTGARRRRSGVPTALAVFAHDVGDPPLRRAGPTTSCGWTEFDRGGHFAAMEEPELLAR